MNWLGAFTVTAASYALGVLLARGEGERLRTLDSLISFFSYMRRRMSQERMPLYAIFSEFEDAHLEGKGFLPVLRSHKNTSKLLWPEAVKRLSADAEIHKELLRFGESLGSLTLDMQLKRIDSVISFLASAREDLRESLPAEQKSIKTVCLLAGLMTAIILL